MLVAIDEAEKAGLRDEVPVGAAIYDHEHGHIVAKAGNNVRSLNDPTAHAEILVIREACKKIGQSRLAFFSLYVTLEPCHMCCMAIVHARIRNVYFALLDEKTGAVISNGKFFDKNFLNHQVSYDYGMYAEESKKLLQDFFQQKR